MRRLLAAIKMWWRCRGLEDWQKQNAYAGLDENFELPYPYPRNEHEDGMNWVAVNGVASARSDW